MGDVNIRHRDAVSGLTGDLRPRGAAVRYNTFAAPEIWNISTVAWDTIAEAIFDDTNEDIYWMYLSENSYLTRTYMGTISGVTGDSDDAEIVVLDSSGLQVATSMRLSAGTLTYAESPSVAEIAAQITSDHGSGAYNGTAGIAPRDQNAVAAAYTWNLPRRFDGVVIASNIVTVIKNEAALCAFDFTDLLDDSRDLTSMATPTIISGGTAGATLTATGIDHKLAKLDVTGLVAGTYVVECQVYAEGNWSPRGRGTLKVVQ